jgi:hypothetical protein
MLYVTLVHITFPPFNPWICKNTCRQSMRSKANCPFNTRHDSCCWEDIFSGPAVAISIRHVSIEGISGIKFKLDFIRFLLMYSHVLEKNDCEAWCKHQTWVDDRTDPIQKSVGTSWSYLQWRRLLFTTGKTLHNALYPLMTFKVVMA